VGLADASTSIVRSFIELVIELFHFDQPKGTRIIIKIKKTLL
jgi:hypothetical protein